MCLCASSLSIGIFFPVLFFQALLSPLGQLSLPMQAAAAAAAYQIHVGVISFLQFLPFYLRTGMHKRISMFICCHSCAPCEGESPVTAHTSIFFIPSPPHTHKNTSTFELPPAAFPAHALHARESHVTAHTRIFFIPSPPPHTQKHQRISTTTCCVSCTRAPCEGEPCHCSYKDLFHTITTTHTQRNTSPFELPPAAFPAHTLHARGRAMSVLIQGSYSYHHHHTHKKHQPI